MGSDSDGLLRHRGRGLCRSDLLHGGRLLGGDCLSVEELLAVGPGRSRLSGLGGLFGVRLGHNGIAVGHFSFCFSALGLRRSLAPNGAERLFLLALDHLFGRSVLALQLEMLLDRIIEYAHRAEPYRGRLDGHGSAIRGAATAPRVVSTRFLPARLAR